MPTPPIGLIAPTQEIANRACEIAKELGMRENLSWHVASLQEALGIARELEADGVEVLIARSGTAELISRELPTPLVQIPISPQDMATALREAKQLTGLDRPRIALFAIESYRSDLNVIADLIGLDLHIYSIGGEEGHLERQVDQAIAEGAHVIVAGSVGKIMADQRNFPGLMFDSGPMALRTALQEANRVAYARRLEKTFAEHFRIVVETSRDGILVMDDGGRIQIANPSASRILGLSCDPVGTRLEEVLPLPSMEDNLTKGEATLDALVTTPTGSIIVTVAPTLINADVQGAVVSFQPAESITQLETKIRTSLYSKRFAPQYSFDDILGTSAQIMEAMHVARSFARSPNTVLLSGETGTGKELFAHAIHAASDCADGPFVAVNCSALPLSLLESELFGYEEGAFTGANRKGKPGLFELAHRGTIFLDEISEMNRYAQLRLLRVLQEHRTMRLGGDRDIPVEVRVIAATNRDLWELVQRGKFRQDLFYRLNVLALSIPPLRERKGDIPLLAEHLAWKSRSRHARAPRLSQPALDRMERYPWPGNVRELQNVMERLTLVKSSQTVRSTDLDGMLASVPCRHPDSRPPAPCPDDTPPPEKLAPVALAERARLVQALRQCRGHQGQAAALLGMERTTLYRKMRRYGIRKQVL